MRISQKNFFFSKKKIILEINIFQYVNFLKNFFLSKEDYSRNNIFSNILQYKVDTKHS